MLSLGQYVVKIQAVVIANSHEDFEEGIKYENPVIY